MTIRFLAKVLLPPALLCCIFWLANTPYAPQNSEPSPAVQDADTAQNDQNRLQTAQVTNGVNGAQTTESRDASKENDAGRPVSDGQATQEKTLKEARSAPEKSGEAFVIRPFAELHIGSVCRDRSELRRVYNHGRRAAEERLAALKEWMR